MTTISAPTHDEVGILLTAAMRARSINGTRPCRLEIDGSVVDILLDSSPAENDPAGRLARVGAGAAAFNVRVAAAMLGHETTIALDPDPAVPEVVARIFLADRRAPVHVLSSLYGDLTRRDTYRGPVIDQPMSPLVLDRLGKAARAECADLYWINQHQRDLLLDLVPDRVAFEPAPAISILTTREEDERAWTRSGLALQRVLLTAASYGLTASYLEPARTDRARLRDLVCRTGWPQLVIRAGC
ncbi:hypothetical protein ACIBL3_32735 [Kribbella sp. NPDC050124]|uniref:hypothetical protein n=1 Tax=Kribbella sp. NPDC050124 TaxID=3364114 RepID=UPI0037893D9E